MPKTETPSKATVSTEKKAIKVILTESELKHLPAAETGNSRIRLALKEWAQMKGIPCSFDAMEWGGERLGHRSEKQRRSSRKNAAKARAARKKSRKE